MTDKATENNQSPQPLGLGSTEGLGLCPKRAVVEKWKAEAVPGLSALCLEPCVPAGRFFGAAMDLSIEQQAVLQRLLGRCTAKFERHGAYFASKRTPEMDALVSAGAMRVEESIEPWGPCVTYIVTDSAKSAMALVALRA